MDPWSHLGLTDTSLATEQMDILFIKVCFEPWSVSTPPPPPPPPHFSSSSSSPCRKEIYMIWSIVLTRSTSLLKKFYSCTAPRFRRDDYNTMQTHIYVYIDNIFTYTNVFMVVVLVVTQVWPTVVLMYPGRVALR